MTDPDTTVPWYAAGLRFRCTRCGNCCSGAPGYVWVTTDDIRRIAVHVGLSAAEFKRKHVRRVGRADSLLERPGGDCEFLERLADRKTRCRIHVVRPVQCRTWPFWRTNLDSPKAWELTAQHCPGINTGKRHPLPTIGAALNDTGRRAL